MPKKPAAAADSSSKKRFVTYRPRWHRWGLGLVGVAVLVVVIAIWAPHLSTVWLWQLRRFLPSIIAVVLPLILAAVLMLIASGKHSKLLELLAWTLPIVAFLGLAFWAWLWVPYQQAHRYYESASITTDPVPTLANRAPYTVASAQANPNLGDTSGAIADTSYLPDRDTFATLVKRRGTLAGYQIALEQQVPLTGRGQGHTCSFSPQADRRVGGLWGHKLDRLINSQQRGVRTSEKDTYAYCEGDTAMVVTPLRKQVGTFIVTERPAGVAVYDGGSGELRIVTDPAELAKIPGPTYPISLAEKQRKSLTASGSWWEWLMRRSGYEDTSDQKDDPNSGNTAEFTLTTTGQSADPLYVTPLTGRGAATAISAVSTVAARQGGSGALNPIAVHRLNPAWVSTGAIAARIKADYQDIPNWPNLQIFEVIPHDSTTWSATIGNEQNVLYRVIGSGTLRDPIAKDSAAVTCLQRADLTTVRCGTVADSGGRGPGVQFGESPAAPGSGAAAPDSSGAPSPTAIPTNNLTTLSPAQLAELQRRLTEEINRRLTGAATPAR